MLTIRNEGYRKEDLGVSLGRPELLRDKADGEPKAGSGFVESLLTVIETCRQQHQRTFEYFATAVAAQCVSDLTPRC